MIITRQTELMPNNHMEMEHAVSCKRNKRIYAYVNEMRDSGCHPKGWSNFNQALREAFPDLQEERLRSHGKALLIWCGIVLKEGAKTWSPSIR